MTIPILLRAGLSLLAPLALLPSPALGQYIGGAPPPLPVSPDAGVIETPAATLARAVRTLARSPRDFAALIAAGRAAVDLGDMQAAIGFFGRAEEVRPADPAPKIGMGAAMVATGDARGALSWFFQAQQLGATSAAIGADRGLAQDLLGNQAAAQTDYRAALAGPARDDARRRLALSLGISGDRSGAFAALQPLLMRRDPAAQRVRAFVLALVGDERGASSAIDSAMPGTGSRMAGFFRLLPSLTTPQKAAAVHLGVFPDPSEIRVAAVSPRPAPTAQAPLIPRVAETRPAQTAARQSRRTRPVKLERGVRIASPTLSPISPADVTPPPAQPSAAISVPVAVAAVVPAPTGRSPTATPPQPGFGVAAKPPVEVKAAPPVEQSAALVAVVGEPSPDAGAPLVAMSGDRLSGIDRLLAQADELPVPPAPKPRFERRVERSSPAEPKAAPNGETKSATAKKTADAKTAAEVKKAGEVKKAADAKKAAELEKAADVKAKAVAEAKERQATGLAGTNWVQLAGGANADRMGTEFKRLAAKSSALKKRGGAVTEGKDYFRLLTGPFVSKSEAQAFVNQLAKDGVDGFSWTRTPAAIRIEKITPK